jgi:predicted DNA-binding transcriptional regulator AlpA
MLHNHAAPAAGPAPQDDALLDPVAEAAFLGVKTATLADWRVKRQGPPHVKVGRLIRYPLAATREWLKARTVTPGPEAA